MGRKAGGTAEQTRSELLEAAARVFALKGYDGASIADICSEAGLSTGPVYAHYGSKAELFVAVLEAHGPQPFRELIGRGAPGQQQFGGLIGSGAIDNVAAFLVAAGSRYDRRKPSEAALVVEAMVAS